MPFEKGQGKIGGRKKGVKNKDTSEIRAAFLNIVEGNIGNVGKWLERTAKNDPAKAIDSLAKLAEYCLPKLARTEITGEDGKDMVIVISPKDPEDFKP